MQIIDGKKIAQNILSEIQMKIQKEKIQPGLGVFLIGNNEASETYVELKKNAAEKIGIKFFLERFSADATQEEIIAKIQEYNQDEKISGIIVQLPLPEKFITQEIIDAIDLRKDVDGFSAQVGHPEDKLLPVFPMAITELIKSTGVNLENKKATILVNSKIFGEAMKKMLEENKIVADYVLIGDLENKKSILQEADIFISAVGQTGIIKAEMVKENAIVIDGGITKFENKILGDVDFETVKDKVSFISPVPGGVGPMTIACLLRNVYLAMKK